MTVTDLGPLLGGWSGPGQGHYPTIADFAYVEHLDLVASPKGFVVVTQRTTNPDGTVPMHAETMYLRPGPDGAVEAVVAQPTGLVEVHHGTFDGRVLDVSSVQVSGTGTAKVPEAVRRRMQVDGDVVVVDLWMAWDGHPLTHHLRSELVAR